MRTLIEIATNLFIACLIVKEGCRRQTTTRSINKRKDRGRRWVPSQRRLNDLVANGQVPFVMLTR